MMIHLFIIIRIPKIVKCQTNNQSYYPPTDQFIADFLARYLTVLNSSVNVLIYCMVGPQFRNVLLKTLGLREIPEETRSIQCKEIIANVFIPFINILVFKSLLGRMIKFHILLNLSYI